MIQVLADTQSPQKSCAWGLVSYLSVSSRYPLRSKHNG
jgi:hypothetical protein